jgi:hypothetical protein
MKPPVATAKVWRWPIALGVLSLIGLLSALFGDGAWDLASGLALALLVAICGWLLLIAGKRTR